MAHNVLVRAIRHAERDDLMGRNVAALVKPPKGQLRGRPPKSLTPGADGFFDGGRSGNAAGGVHRPIAAVRDAGGGGAGAAVGSRGGLGFSAVAASRRG